MVDERAQVIHQTWQRLHERLAGSRAGSPRGEIARKAFCAGLYSAAAAIASDQAGGREISEAAGHIENSQRDTPP